MLPHKGLGFRVQDCMIVGAHRLDLDSETSWLIALRRKPGFLVFGSAFRFGGRDTKVMCRNPLKYQRHSRVWQPPHHAAPPPQVLGPLRGHCCADDLPRQPCLTDHGAHEGIDGSGALRYEKSKHLGSIRSLPLYTKQLLSSD